MEQEIVRLAASQGLWAVLFVALLFYVLKQNRDREIKLETTIDKNQDIIEELTKGLNIVSEIKEDIKDIKGMLNRERR